MPLEVLDVVDSAVKIGLGAAIAGITTYVTTRANHANEKKKELRSHKIKTIEVIAEKCEQLINCQLRFRGKLRALMKNRTTENEYQLADGALKALNEYDEKIFPALEGATTALARLSLMSEDDAEKSLRNLLRLISNLRNFVMMEKKAPSVEAWLKSEDELNDAVADFQSKLAEVYEEIQ